MQRQMTLDVLPFSFRCSLLARREGSTLSWSRVLRQRMLNSVFHRCSLTGLGCLRTSSGGKQGVLPDPLDEPAALPSSGALLPAP